MQVAFLVDLHTTHESTLEVELDASGLDWDLYKKMIIELEDLLSEIDKKTSPKPDLARGRSLKARYTRVTADERHRRIRFSPFPSMFTNRIKNLRSYLYKLLNDSCITLSKYGSGNVKRCVYILPKYTALQFVKMVDETNKTVIEKLRRDIEEFRKSDDFLSIVRLLTKYGLNADKLMVEPFTIGDVIMDVVPISFDYDVMSDALLEKEARASAMESLAILKREIDRFHREYAVRTVKDIVSKLWTGIELLGSGRKARFFDRKIEKMIGICESMGLSEVNERLLKPLLEISRDPKNVKLLSKKYFGTESLTDGVKAVVEKLS